MTVSIETLEALLDASFRFTQALYDDKDPYKRHQRFYWNSVLAGMDGVMPAFASSRLIARADLAKPGKEIERAILYWEREAKGNH
jgi:hypothetical protein